MPLLDGISCGVRQAELLARARYPKPTVGSYASPGVRELVNVEPAIDACFRGALGRRGPEALSRDCSRPTVANRVGAWRL